MATVDARLRDSPRRYSDGHTYTLDGFSAEFPDWHFNVRASNTEPMLRLNLEALTPALMEQKRDEVLGGDQAMRRLRGTEAKSSKARGESRSA